MPDLQRLGSRQARVNGTLVLAFIGLRMGWNGVRIGVHGGAYEVYWVPMGWSRIAGLRTIRTDIVLPEQHLA
jgi:hypothetical protein